MEKFVREEEKKICRIRTRKREGEGGGGLKSKKVETQICRSKR